MLGLLKDTSMHGYELKKRLDEQMGHFRRISFGSLYPTLKRLSASGAIEISSPVGDVSRKRNVYHITPAGEAQFTDLLESRGVNVADREEFMLGFTFSRYMKPETRRRLLEGRRGYLQDRLQKMSASLKRMRDRMDTYSREIMQYGVTETEHDIRWLNDMLAAEGLGGLGNTTAGEYTTEVEPIIDRAVNGGPVHRSRTLGDGKGNGGSKTSARAPRRPRAVAGTTRRKSLKGES